MSNKIVEGEAVPLSLQLTFGETDRFPRALVYNLAGTLLDTIDLVHRASGFYTATSFDMPASDIVAQYLTYTDSGHTALDDDNPSVSELFTLDLDAKATDLAAIPTNPLLDDDARLDNLDATVSSRESEASASSRASTNQTEHDATQSAISGLNDLSEADVQNALDSQGYTSARAGNLDNLDATVGSRQSEADAASRAATNQSEHDATQSAISGLTIPTASEIADSVWDETLSGHLTSGSTGAALNDAGSSSSPSAIADAVYEAVSGDIQNIRSADIVGFFETSGEITGLIED